MFEIAGWIGVGFMLGFGLATVLFILVVPAGIGEPKWEVFMRMYTEAMDRFRKT